MNKAEKWISENYQGFEDEFTNQELKDICNAMADYAQSQQREMLELFVTHLHKKWKDYPINMKWHLDPILEKYLTQTNK